MKNIIHLLSILFVVAIFLILKSPAYAITLINPGFDQTNLDCSAQTGWPTVPGYLNPGGCEGSSDPGHSPAVMKTHGGTRVSQTASVPQYSGFTASVQGATSSSGQANMGVQLGGGPITWTSSTVTSWTTLSISGNTGSNTSLTIYISTDYTGGGGVSDTYYDNAALTINNGAGCTGITPPSSGSVNAGQVYTASVQMTNVGSSTWTSGSNYRLGSQDPQDNTSWGFSRVSLPSDTAPGQTANFTFSVTAPASGCFNFDWEMVQDGVEWFGQKCVASQQICVNAPTATPTPTIAIAFNPPTATPTPTPAGTTGGGTWCGTTCIIDNGGPTSITACTSTGNNYLYVQTSGYPAGHCATSCLACPAGTTTNGCGCTTNPTPKAGCISNSDCSTGGQYCPNPIP